MKIIYNSRKKYRGFNWIWGLILIGVALTIMAAISQPAEKKYKYEDVLPAFIKGDKWLNIAKQALLRSDLPAKDVTMIIDSLSEYQNKIVLQVNSQLEADKKLEKPKQDSTKTKN